MKRTLGVFTIALGSLLGAAADYSAGTPSGLLINHFGLHQTPDGVLDVNVSASEGKLRFTWRGHFSTLSATNPITKQVSVSHNARIANTYSMPGWKAKPGWFVFVESNSRIWSYDGENRLWLLLLKSDGSSANYESPCFPCPVPPEALARVSASMKNEIQSHRDAELGGAANRSQPLGPGTSPAPAPAGSVR